MDESGYCVIGDELRDALGWIRTVRAEPMGGPVEGAEKGPRRHRGLGAAAALLGDQRPNTALVTIALGDDPLAEAGWEGIDLQMRPGAFHFVDQAEDVGDREISKARGERPSILPGERQRRQQAVQ